MLTRLHGNERKINACQMNNFSADWDDNYFESLIIERNYIAHELQVVETDLLTRLSDETIRGIINFMKATTSGTPIYRVEKALVSKSQGNEYLFSDNVLVIPLKFILGLFGDIGIFVR